MKAAGLAIVVLALSGLFPGGHAQPAGNARGQGEPPGSEDDEEAPPVVLKKGQRLAPVLGERGAPDLFDGPGKDAGWLPEEGPGAGILDGEGYIRLPVQRAKATGLILAGILLGAAAWVARHLLWPRKP